VPRARFQNLDAARRAAILRSAAEEFAEHGFEGASYNRIIERSGLSKGAMYYYFDDKEDLYITTLSDALTRLMLEAGSLTGATTAAAFWRASEAWSRRSIQLFQEDPAAIGLARSLQKSIARGTGSGALTELRRLAQSFMEAFVAQGQALGAVRSDLPEGLLIRILTSLEEAVDLWLADHLGARSSAELDQLAKTITGLYRRVVEPPPGARTPAQPRRKRGK